MTGNGPVRVALLGAGARGELNLGTIIKRHPDRLRFVAVAEADEGRRNTFVERYGIPRENAFADWRDLVARPQLADAVINALPCRMHRESTIPALEAGYHVLLEKPMALTPGECIALRNAADAADRLLMITTQNRFNAIYKRTRSDLDGGVIGRLMNIDCGENIGYWHFILSYVRGIHHRTDMSHSFVMAKGVHDLDLIAWFAGAPATRVSSFGGLSFFTEANAPAGAPERCVDGCPVEATCPFSAIKQFVDPGRPAIPWSLMTGMSGKAAIDFFREPRFRTTASVITHDISREARLRMVRETINGRCVFRCDNNVVDHQTVNVEFANGVTASYSLSAFSVAWERTLNLHGTKGEIRTADFTGRYETRTFPPRAGHAQAASPYHGILHGRRRRGADRSSSPTPSGKKDAPTACSRSTTRPSRTCWPSPPKRRGSKERSWTWPRCAGAPRPRRFDTSIHGQGILIRSTPSDSEAIVECDPSSDRGHGTSMHIRGPASTRTRNPPGIARSRYALSGD